MQAIEFEADLKGSKIQIPSYAKIRNRHVKVILMYEQDIRSKAVNKKCNSDIFDKFKLDIKEKTFDRNEANER